MASYHTERLSATNIHHLATIYKAVYGKTISTDHYIKKYDTAYLGKSYLAFLAFNENNEPVSFKGFIPFRFAYKNETELGAISCDSMTIPGYNGKGIFTNLSKLGEQLLESEGINFMYSFPNQNSEHVSKNKLGRHYAGQMIGFKISTSTLPIEKIVRKLGLGSFYKKMVNRKMRSLQSKERFFPHSMSADHYITTIRDLYFFNYKSFTPNFIIELNAIKIWVKPEHQMLIGDIDTVDEDTFLKTISELKKICFKLGLTQLIFQVQVNTAHEMILKKHFKSFISWPIHYRNINSKIPLENLRFNLGDLDTF